MKNETMQLKEELMHKAGYIAANMGLNKSMGQIYTALYLSSKAMPLEDLAKSCRMSKGNASINIRRLERWGAVTKSWANDNRKDYYEANRDILGFSLNHGLKVLSDRVQDGENIIENTLKKLSGVHISGDSMEKENLEHYMKNLKELDGLIKRLKGLLNNANFFTGIIKSLK